MAKVVSYIFAGNTISPTPIMASIISIIGMSLRAVGLTRLPFRNLLRAVASQGIFPTGDSLQVVRVYAGRITAKMVKFQTRGYFTLRNFICKSMCQYDRTRTIFSTTNSKTSITLPIPCTNPKPALLRTTYRNLCPKAICSIHTLSISNGLGIVKLSNSIV